MDRRTPITELDLGTKEARALDLLGVRTIGGFLQVDIERVLGMRGVGHRTLRRLLALREDVGLWLGDPGNARGSQVAYWGRVLNRLGARTKNGLAKLQIRSLDEFMGLRREQFLAVRSIGRTCWHEVKREQERIQTLLPSNRPLNKSAERLSQESTPSGDDAGLLADVKAHLNGRAHILDDLNIKSFTRLSQLSYEEVTSLQGVGPKAWKRLQDAIREASRRSATSSTSLDTGVPARLDDYPLFTGLAVTPCISPESLHPDTPVAELGLPSRALRALNILTIDTLGELLHTRPDSLLSLPNFGDKSLVALRNSVREYISFHESSATHESSLGESFEEFVQRLFAHSSQPGRATRILRDRLGLCKEGIRTYDAIAADHRCSKERIRQMLSKSIGAVTQHYRSTALIERFYDAVRVVLNQGAGILEWSDLCKGLAELLAWKYPAPELGLRSFMRLLTQECFRLNDDTIAIAHPCRSCGTVVESLQRLAASSSSGVLYISDLRRRGTELCSINGSICPHAQQPASPAFIAETAERAHLHHDSQLVYSDMAWALYTGGLSQQVTAAAKHLEQACSPEDIAEVLCGSQEPLPAVADIHSAMIRADSLCVWGRREFLHRDLITVDSSMLALLSKTIETRLATAPFIAAHGIYRELRDACQRASIPNDYALSSVVSACLPSFHVDRYRYVHPGASRTVTRIDHVLEEWVQNQNGEVSRQQVNDWVMNSIGGRESLVGMALSRLSSVFASRRGHLVHIDNTGLTPASLEPFFSHARTALENHESIGVRALMRDQQVRCYQLSIHSPLMLYGAMRHFCPDDLDLPRYPHITRAESESIATIGDALSLYVLDCGTVVAVDACAEYFEKKGYSPVQVRARIGTHPDILPLYAGCVVHKDVAGWNESCASVLAHALIEAYRARRATGCLVGDLGEVLDLHEDMLPALASDLSWTGDLLASLARRQEDIIILGNAGRAYSVPNVQGSLVTMEDLLVAVVRDIFRGGCSRDALDRWLYEHGIVRTRLLDSMFDALDGLTIGEYECLWRGDDE